MTSAPKELDGQLREPLQEALSEEIVRLERVTVRIWQFMYLVGILIALTIAATIAPVLGLWCAMAAAGYLGWFLLYGYLIRREPPRRSLRVVATIVDGTMPWIFTIVLVFTEGAEYALSSWVPPMLFCALLVASTVRFHPIAPMLFGLTGGAMYPILYVTVVQGRLGADAAGELLYQPPMQVSRSVTLVIGGILTALVTAGVRHVVGRAERVVRERDLFGKYRMVRQIASGGMGTVWEALYCPEGGFERRVAVKRVHAHLAEQKKFVTDFRAEAELGSRLAHPNIVQVMDFGRIESSYFLAMEYIDGITLAQFMGRAFRAHHPIELGVAGQIARELLAGLVHAHEGARGGDGQPLRVVHRDLCPQNVLLSTNGEVKITDFGVARALGESVAAYTRTVAGHAAYMAPEQARGEGVDERSDLFPVGVILWELLAGRRLFARDSEAATLMALVTDDLLPVAAIRTDIDPAWDRFLARTLEREPDARFASAREMALALESLPGSRVERAAEQIAVLVESLGLTEEETAPSEDNLPTATVTAVSDPSASKLVH